MPPLKALLALLLVSLAAVDASPFNRRTGKGTLSFATRINESGVLKVVEKDRARANALRRAGHLGKRDASISIANAGMDYVAQIGIGSPATNYTLLVDTGSSNTWVGVSTPYTRTSTSHDTGNAVSVSYGSSGFSGEEWTDTVTLGPSLVVKNQSIGVAHSVTGIKGIDGILGIGPTDLTLYTVGNTATVPTVSDNLYSQGTISMEALGVYFVPASESSSAGGVTFGGVDNSVITSPVNYVSLTTTFPASSYWGIDQSVSYGGSTILSTTAGIVDTGTTFTLIASDAFQRYQSLTGSTLDSATGLLAITPSRYSKLKTLSFHVGGTSYDLSPNAQIWPRSLNTMIGGSASSIYLVVANLGTPSGAGFDFVDGFTFLERYYSVYDTTNRRVGFASTAYTHAIVN